MAGKSLQICSSNDGIRHSPFVGLWLAVYEFDLTLMIIPCVNRLGECYMENTRLFGSSWWTRGELGNLTLFSECHCYVQIFWGVVFFCRSRIFCFGKKKYFRNVKVGRISCNYLRIPSPSKNRIPSQVFLLTVKYEIFWFSITDR